VTTDQSCSFHKFLARPANDFPLAFPQRVNRPAIVFVLRGRCRMNSPDHDHERFIQTDFNFLAVHPETCMMDIERDRECAGTVAGAIEPRRHCDERQEFYTARLRCVCAGLDVDKRSISVTVSNHHGFICSLHMPYSAEHLIKHVRKHFGNQKVAFATRPDQPGMDCMMGS
jgi:hypothetical protein